MTQHDSSTYSSATHRLLRLDIVALERGGPSLLLLPAELVLLLRCDIVVRLLLLLLCHVRLPPCLLPDLLLLRQGRRLGLHPANELD